MIYVASDLHGNLDKWKDLLSAIRFSGKDELYVLGDIVDRGEEPIALLFDMMCRPNVFPILGNHEYSFKTCIRRLPPDAVLDDFMTFLNEEELVSLTLWIKDGGRPTLEQYMALPPEDREEILDYLDEFSLYEEVSAGGQDYLLTHSGIMNFSPEKSLEDYAIADFLFDRPDPEKTFYPDSTLICGHTPTFSLPGGEAGKIYKARGFINIDCGAGWPEEGGTLGCLRLDDQKEFYV